MGAPSGGFMGQMGSRVMGAALPLIQRQQAGQGSEPLSKGQASGPMPTVDSTVAASNLPEGTSPLDRFETMYGRKVSRQGRGGGGSRAAGTVLAGGSLLDTNAFGKKTVLGN